MIEKKQNVLIHTYGHNSKFFLRLSKALELEGKVSHFLTNRIHVFFLLAIRFKKVHLVRRCKITNAYDSVAERAIKESNTLLYDNIGFEEARRCYNSYQSKVEKINEKFNIKLFITWNGCRVSDLAIKDYCRKHKIPQLYLELANVEGKIFADPYGVNAQSSLYFSPIALDSELQNTDFEGWRKKYIESRLRQHKVPQMRQASQFDKIKKCLSTLLYYLNYLVTQIKDASLDAMSGVKNYDESNIAFDSFENSNKYYFFPLQVSSDSQVRLNSGIGLVEALELAAEASKNENVELLVKLHPAEFDNSTVKSIIELRQKFKFRLVNENTFKLIINAQKVFTINSSVGLEALICNKPVVFLGKTFFSHFNTRRLENYIFSYLIDINFFNNEVINQSQIQKLLARSKLLPKFSEKETVLDLKLEETIDICLVQSNFSKEEEDNFNKLLHYFSEGLSGVKFNIFIYDNTSKDVGVTKARNILLDQSKSDFVCFLEANLNLIKVDWIEIIKYLKKNQNVGILTPLTARMSTFVSSRRWQAKRNIPGNLMIIRKSLFGLIGDFDERFYSAYADSDFVKRALEKNFLVIQDNYSLVEQC